MTGCRVKQRNCQIQTYLLPQSSQQDFVRYRLHSVCANTRMHAVLICRIYFVRLKRRKFLWVAGWSSGTLSYYHLQTFVEQVSLSLLNFLSFCLSLSASFSRSLLPLSISFFPFCLSIRRRLSLSLSFPFFLSLCFRISHLCTYTYSSTDNEENNPQQSYFFYLSKIFEYQLEVVARIFTIIQGLCEDNVKWVYM